MGGKIVNSEWFTQRIPVWKGRKLALFCVGASPNENPDVEVSLHNALTEEEHKYAKVFYCQGGLNYDKMSMPNKMLMKMLKKSLDGKKDKTPQEEEMAQMIGRSYDISDRRYAEPVIAWIKGSNS